MKGRLFVVNSDTIEKTIANKIASIITPQPKGNQWIKTMADIMADMLQIEIGDYIFLWETSGKKNKSRIYGVYRAISKPYYECTGGEDDAPFKIHIEEAYHFEQPIDEYEILNCPYTKNEMWTIVGKKVAGKSRGTSPLSPNEIKNLITLLIDKNPDYSFYEFDESHIVDVERPLEIKNVENGIHTSPGSLSNIHPNNISYVVNGNVRYEKVLETIFNQEMTNRNKRFYGQLGIDVDKVVWYSNYLPYSIEQSEMDYVVLQSDDGMCVNKIYVVEFQKGKIDEDHIRRCLLYSKWVNETLALGANIVHPILICNKSYDFNNGETHKARKRRVEQLETVIVNYVSENVVNDLSVYEYTIGSEVQFNCKREARDRKSERAN